MKMYFSEKSDFNNGNSPLVREYEFDSRYSCERNLFIEQIVSWVTLFKFYMKTKKAHKKGTRIEVKVTVEF